ncbi:DUF3102 domain-containing protein [Oscillospiraceae bacterium 50-16]
MSNTFTQAHTTALPSAPNTTTEILPTSPIMESLDVEPAATSTELSANVQRVEMITTEILQHKRQVFHSFIQIGLLLDEARGRLKKEGQWLYWLKNSVDISPRMAQRYIQVAQAFPDATAMSHLGMTKALALLALPEAQRENFINELHEVNGKQKTVSNMSVRELHRAIHEKMELDKLDDVSAEEDGKIANKDEKSPSKLLPVVHRKNQNPAGQNCPEKQTEPSGFGKLTADIESAQTYLDSIVKLLERQGANDIEQGRIADDLRLLHQKVIQCLSLAKLEIPTNG